MNKKKSTVILDICKYLILIAGAISMLFPFIWMVLTSFKSVSESVAIPPTWFPSEWLISNFNAVFETAPFGQYFVNTVIISTLSTVITILITILASFALSVLDFRGKNFIFYLFLGTMMIPSELLIIQNYVTVSKLGWLDTYQGIVLPMISAAFYIYLLRENFLQLPPMLYKAAKIDGCSDWKYLWKILVPNSVSSIATIGILNFITTWNSFLWPIMVTNTDAKRVLTIGLMHFNNSASSRINLQMAGAMIVIMPMVILYLIFRKQIMQGVSRGGLKG
ncbi:MAG: carbohydrate ABC transporter permease [Clostridium sp.]|uniref:carbohydrate ABC transporter permease n=1 Tax=Clostridium sp. TaxID=1506 RepID=UPI002A891754|nr:carbohydrate ABC transporter permease [Clostridium sp.]MDY5097950.1 carbohydrate ABC transporter permease [Clostridium sp.]